MNKLAYGLLSILANEALTGYDLVQKIGYLWPTTHSSIYPLLGEIENKGLATCSIVEQTGKPDKKIYSITPAGRHELKQWLTAETNAPICRDEATLKLIGIQSFDAETALAILAGLAKQYQEKQEMLRLRIDDLHRKFGEGNISLNTERFGSYILVTKALRETEADLAWCEWARGLISRPY